MLLFSFAFYAVILANILFLTEVWGWSVLNAGFAVTPAPLMAAFAAPIAGKAVGRLGQGPVALAGSLFFAAGATWYALFLDPTPDYVSEFLPGALLGGTGVGLSFASWGSASMAELPPPVFATGSGIVSTLRQLGAVLGIAVLVAVLEAGAPTNPVGAFENAYTVMAGVSLAAGVVALALRRSQQAAAAVELHPRAQAAPEAEAA